MTGEQTGPSVVTAVQSATARPRVTGLENISAYTAPTTPRHGAADSPQKSRRTRKPGQSSTTAVPIVNRRKSMKEPTRMILRPNISESGARIIGPMMCPIKKTDMGRAIWYLFVTSKCAAMKDIEPEGMLDPMVPFSVMTIVRKAIYIFFLCYRRHQFNPCEKGIDHDLNWIHLLVTNSGDFQGPPVQTRLQLVHPRLHWHIDRVIYFPFLHLHQW